jgi:hypothetical protein
MRPATPSDNFSGYSTERLSISTDATAFPHASERRSGGRRGILDPPLVVVQYRLTKALGFA